MTKPSSGFTDFPPLVRTTFKAARDILPITNQLLNRGPSMKVQVSLPNRPARRLVIWDAKKEAWRSLAMTKSTARLEPARDLQGQTDRRQRDRSPRFDAIKPISRTTTRSGAEKVAGAESMIEARGISRR
jgi:hypothetical protein